MAESQLIKELRSAGLRATPARRAVVGVLEDHRRHLSAEDIHGILAAEGVGIDLSSVYRTLALLVRLGLVRAVGPSERHSHFEVGHREQVHLVCGRCGEVIEARLRRDARVHQAVAALARSRGFGLADFTIEGVGECAACRQAGNEQESGIASARAPSCRPGARKRKR